MPVVLLLQKPIYLKTFDVTHLKVFDLVSKIPQNTGCL